MLIVSKIEREGGSTVSIGATVYHFVPTGKAQKHMCEVDNKQHIARFLSISEGFEAYDPKEAEKLFGSAPPAEPAPQPQQEQPTPEKQLEDNIEPENNADAADAAEANEDDAEAKLETQVEPDTDDGLEAMDDITLAHAYEDEFDKKPGNMKRNTMIARIRKARADADAE